jgi:hypothetical protein
MPVLVRSTPDIIRRFPFHQPQIYQMMHHHRYLSHRALQHKKAKLPQLIDWKKSGLITGPYFARHNAGAHAYPPLGFTRIYLSIPPVSLHPDPRLEFALDHIE